MSRAGDLITNAANLLRAGEPAPFAANDLSGELRGIVNRLAASLAEIKHFAPAQDPARIEAEAALLEFREGSA